MSLDKNDLKSIEKIVRGSEDRLNNRISSVEIRLDKKIDGLDEKFNKKIDILDIKLNKKMDALDEKIDKVEENVISTLGREISDLTDINRAVISRTEQLDCRLRIVKRKLGLSIK